MRRQYYESDASEINKEVNDDINTLKAIFNGYEVEDDPEYTDAFITDGLPDAEQYESDEDFVSKEGV